jgi:hypothetical protein
MFQITIVTQIAIVIVFWVSLYPSKEFKIFKSGVCENRAVPCFFLYADHWLPFALISMDWLISQAVFLKRHWILFFAFMVFYWLFNLAWSSLAGAPIYPIIDWSKKEATYIIVPLGIAVNVATFFALDWITIKKLECQGEQEILDIIRFKKKDDEVDQNNIEITIEYVQK